VSSFAKIDRRQDAMADEIQERALAKLSPDERRRIENMNNPEHILTNLGALIGRPSWDRIEDRVRKQLPLMTSSGLDANDKPIKPTTIISALLQETTNSRDIEQHVVEMSVPKKLIEEWKSSEKGWMLTSDARFCSIAHDDLCSPELQFRLQEHRWQEQRKHEEYRKISLATDQICQFVLNRLVELAKKTCKGKIAIVFENDMSNAFFTSNRRGKRRATFGWDQMCAAKPKGSRSWFVRPFAKALKALATEKGELAIEVVKNLTSLRCPECGNIDRASRFGEDFQCTKCPFKGHADIDVACHNIAHVAKTGQKIERSHDDETTKKRSQKKKPLKSKLNVV
jgi:predicted RNA-binding Zn-ribbon protein involved in translation (DUF1610 family)